MFLVSNTKFKELNARHDLLISEFNEVESLNKVLSDKYSLIVVQLEDALKVNESLNKQVKSLNELNSSYVEIISVLGLYQPVDIISEYQSRVKE